MLSVSFIWPQVFRVFIKNSTEGLVPGSLLQGCCGSLLWTIYGLNKPDSQLIFANANIVIAILLILSVCVKHKKIVWWIPALTISLTLIFGAIATAWPDAGVDVLFGIGGTPEGVTSAAALKVLGLI